MINLKRMAKGFYPDAVKSVSISSTDTCCDDDVTYRADEKWALYIQDEFIGLYKTKKQAVADIEKYL